MGRALLMLLSLGLFCALLAGCASAPPPPGGYRVMGEVYFPLDSADGYSEVGVASWYGKKFHGRLTANGEVYDMYARTAAHKTLPLGTTVRVTRLDNGRQVTARINDRGPFVKERIIDLSFTLADELDMVVDGTARVRVETISGPAAKVATGGESYSWQVGSFSSRANADQTAEKVRAGFEGVRVVSAQVKGATYYRVRVGSYTSKSAAEDAYPKLTRMGFDPIIVTHE